MRGQETWTWIVVAAEPITDIDATAGETLFVPSTTNSTPSASSWRSRSSRTRYATGSDATASRSAIGSGRFFPTIGVAVAAYLAETNVDWLDWEDR